MAEAARRMGHGHGSDVVRRLIARPIRMQSAQVTKATAAVSARSGEPAAGTVPDMPSEAAGAAAEIRAERRPDVPVIPGEDRLRTEMLLLKAVLQAERRENASLRACLGFDEEDAMLDADVRAMRDRWAALVDRLLHAPA